MEPPLGSPPNPYEVVVVGKAYEQAKLPSGATCNHECSVDGHFTRVYGAQGGWREKMHAALDAAIDDPEVVFVMVRKLSPRLEFPK